MANLRPFRSLRATPESAGRVSAPPYDVVSLAEARALAASNPSSFLRVSRAEIDLPSETDPHSAAVYDQAVASFRRLKAAGALVTEPQPSLYYYRLRAEGHDQTGVAGCWSLEEYADGSIRRHERTRSDKEDDRTRHLLALRAQTGPVFLIHRAVPEIDRLARAGAANRPLLDFVADDGVQHTIWQVPSVEAGGLVAAFARVPALYIADGHHRAASAARARETLRASDEAPSSADWFLAVAFPHEQVRILPYHRTLTDLGGLTPAELRTRLGNRLSAPQALSSPARRGEVAMCLEGAWHTLALGGGDGQLDVTSLQEAVLRPLLGVQDVRTDPRVEFVGGIHGPAELERRVRSGRAAVAFSMFPVAIEDLMQIADAGEMMPPKSTWFEPKLRDGLLIHELASDAVPKP